MSIQRSASAKERRALNQVWNGAGVYGFEPLFLSLNPDGSPNLYLNTIAGCVRKWYGEKEIKELFAAWEGDRRQALLDDLAWLALESGAFARELPSRPVLAELRLSWAASFFDQEQSLSRQEWMAKNQLSYTMQCARWKEVLGQRAPVMTPYEKRLYAALNLGEGEGMCPGTVILEVFSRFRLFNGRRHPSTALRFHLTGKWRKLMTRFMPTELVCTDVVSVAQGVGGGEGGHASPDVRRARIRLRLREDADTDRLYMEGCFGHSLLPARELAMAEQKLCTGIHLGCHLWYTAGVPSPGQAPSGDARRLAEEALLQYERNRRAFEAAGDLYQNAIRRLTEQIQGCIRLRSEREEETACSGRLDSRRVWRAQVLSDRRVFTREMDASRPGFAVDLLLDASSSRLRFQEVIASQGYILAESLGRCKIPVRVSGFCSLRGYTVLRILKDFGDSSREVFRYFASGWNRDGLALRAAGELLRSPKGQEQLLLLLTDAGPSDSRRIPPGGRYPLGRSYADTPAVEDTAGEVRALQNRGIRVGAIFMGPSLNIPAAKIIYGKSLARIRSMDQLAAAAGALMQAKIQEFE